MHISKKQPLLWVAVFLLIFLLSQDYLFTEWKNDISFLGFPVWLGWFMGVHVLFIVSFAYFAIKYWNATK